MAGRNHIPLSGSKLRHNHHPVDDSVPLHPHRRLTPAEVHIIEDRITAQSREIQTLLHDNQRLAATHVALKQDVVTAQQDLRRLSATASSVKAEMDAQVREVYDRSLKLEAEARSVDGLSAELDRVRAEIKELRDERREQTEKLKDIEGDISSSQPELQEFSDLKAEIEACQREIRRGRAAIEYERKMHSNNLKLSEAMGKHMISMAREVEKLRSELANAEQRAMAAVVDAASAANQGAGYAIHQPGYGGNSLSDPHVVHQFNGTEVPRQNVRNNEVVEQFRRFAPPKFKGNEGPMAAEEWILELERIYDHMELTETQKVSCARFQLVEDAGHWWKSHECALTEEQKQTMTWEEFKDMMLGCYFPQAIRDQKEMEFVNLRQGTLPVIEYERRFNQLSKYAPHLVATDERKARRFERGLRPEIRKIVSGLRLPTYREVFDRAQIVSISQNLEFNQVSQRPQNTMGKRKWDNQKGKGNTNNVKKSRPTGSSSAQGSMPSCPTCGKRHLGECLAGRNVCYKCHQPGHRNFECTNSNAAEPPKPLILEKKGNSRAFAMIGQPDEHDTMTGCF